MWGRRWNIALGSKQPSETVHAGDFQWRPAIRWRIAMHKAPPCFLIKANCIGTQRAFKPRPNCTLPSLLLCHWGKNDAICAILWSTECNYWTCQCSGPLLSVMYAMCRLSPGCCVHTLSATRRHTLWWCTHWWLWVRYGNISCVGKAGLVFAWANTSSISLISCWLRFYVYTDAARDAG